ncbi:MAG: transglutaminase domain-containing protein [Byssovorax sp.]
MIGPSVDRRLAGASLLVVAVLLAAVSGRPGASAIAAAVIVAATIAGGRIDLGNGLQRALTVVAAGLGIALGATGTATMSPISPGLDRVWVIAALALLFAAASRLVARAPERGPIVTTVLGLLALMTAGETAAGPAYKLAVALHLALALLALRVADRGRPALSRLPRRTLAIGTALVLAAIALSVSATRALFPMSDWTTAHITLLGGPDATSGFSDRLWLGSLDGMLQSEEVVMRIEGPRPDYLRGAVYDRYELGRWRTSQRGLAQDLAPSVTPPSGPARVAITLAGGALDRYFLPLGARRIVAEGESVVVEPFGTLRVPRGAATAIRFELGAPSDLAIADPTVEDRLLPDELRATVKRLAAEWTQGVDDPAEKIAAIARHFQDNFTYSLEFHQRRREALLDFLLDEHRGHCEYFASAMTLFARAVGVPARVVAGYRVTEHSPFGGYWIVREKNAHAWTEVYLPGRGFVTVDATPGGPAQNADHQLGVLSALRDLVAKWVATADAATGGNLGKITLGAAALGLGLVLAVRRFLRRARTTKSTRRIEPAERPHPSLARLFEALARRGLDRSPSEPIERFATRLDAADHPAPAALLRRYAAQRYGGVGALEPLLGELDACAAQLKATSR